MTQIINFSPLDNRFSVSVWFITPEYLCFFTHKYSANKVLLFFNLTDINAHR